MLVAPGWPELAAGHANPHQPEPGSQDKTKQDNKVTSFQPAWLIRCATPHQGQASAIFPGLCGTSPSSSPASCPLCPTCSPAVSRVLRRRLPRGRGRC